MDDESGDNPLHGDKIELKDESKGESGDKPSDKEIIYLLHSVLYALQTAINTPSKSVLIYTARKLPLFLSKFGFSIDSSKSPEENIKVLLGILQETGYLENVEFVKLDEHLYELRVKKCKIAETGVHDVLKPEKAFCPFAIAVAAILQEVVDEDVVMSESEFTEEGSITKMRTYRYVVV